MPTFQTLTTSPRILDVESQTWIDQLRSVGVDHDRAVRDLHVLLLSAARFEVRRRRAQLGQLFGVEGEDLAQQSADDALLAILGKLEEFRGESRFTTWAYKFALYEAAVKVRRRVWREREVQLDPELWPLIADSRQGAHENTEAHELLAALAHAIENDLSAHQRRVLVAVTLNGIPIDVLAERLGSTRGALYKTLHDARRRLRAALEAQGLGAGPEQGAIGR